MTIEDFKNYVKTGQALDTEEIHRFMDEMSDEARRVTFRLNTAYHTPDEVPGIALRTIRLPSAAVAPRFPAVLCRFRQKYQYG